MNFWISFKVSGETSETLQTIIFLASCHKTSIFSKLRHRSINPGTIGICEHRFYPTALEDRSADLAAGGKQFLVGISHRGCCGADDREIAGCNEITGDDACLYC